MSGRLIAVVGPSGVGKDSLIAGLAQARPDLHVVRRAITRAGDLGGEPYEAVSEDEFERRRAAGAFCLNWGAHGLLYGIPVGTLDELKRGDAVVNLSRGVLGQAKEVAPKLVVLHVTADPAILAQRLAARSRESAEGIAKRLNRTAAPLPADVETVEIDNSGRLETAVARALAVLYPEAVK